MAIIFLFLLAKIFGINQNIDDETWLMWTLKGPVFTRVNKIASLR
jgi:hypothetical protein